MRDILKETSPSPETSLQIDKEETPPRDDYSRGSPRRDPRLNSREESRDQRPYYRDQSRGRYDQERDENPRGERRFDDRGSDPGYGGRR